MCAFVFTYVYIDQRVAGVLWVACIDVCVGMYVVYIIVCAGMCVVLSYMHSRVYPCSVVLVYVISRVYVFYYCMCVCIFASPHLSFHCRSVMT